MSHCQTVQTVRRDTARRFRFAAGAAVATILIFPAPAAAARMPPRPDDTSRTPVVVQRVEVPVPVDDTAAEVVQMQLAAAVAAIVAAATTKARLRRRYARPTTSAVIDLTDPRLLDRQTQGGDEGSLLTPSKDTNSRQQTSLSVSAGGTCRRQARSLEPVIDMPSSASSSSAGSLNAWVEPPAGSP